MGASLFGYCLSGGAQEPADHSVRMDSSFCKPYLPLTFSFTYVKYKYYFSAKSFYSNVGCILFVAIFS